MENDLISRSALLESLDGVVTTDDLFGMGISQGIGFSIERISKAPSVDAGPKWIRVKDRLPEVGKKVLTLDKWGHLKDRELYQFSNGKQVFSPDGIEPGKDVTHWMPIPELPKEK